MKHSDTERLVIVAEDEDGGGCCSSRPGDHQGSYSHSHTGVTITYSYENTARFIRHLFNVLCLSNFN